MGDVPSSVFDDASPLELVNTINEKTREGRLRWRRENKTFEADLPDGSQLVFAVSVRRLLAKTTWSQFIVRRRDGTEVLAVQHTESSNLAGPLGRAGSELQVAVAELFNVVTGSARIEVEKMIEQIKSL